MKNLIMLVGMLVFGFANAQEPVKPVFENEGKLVKATYFYEDGTVRQQGYFKNNKLTGTWVAYNQKGFKTAIATYKNGKKDGKWIMNLTNGLKEVTYKNNKIMDIKSSDVALN